MFDLNASHSAEISELLRLDVGPVDMANHHQAVNARSYIDDITIVRSAQQDVCCWTRDIANRDNSLRRRRQVHCPKARTHQREKWHSMCDNI